MKLTSGIPTVLYAEVVTNFLIYLQQSNRQRIVSVYD